MNKRVKHEIAVVVKEMKKDPDLIAAWYDWKHNMTGFVSYIRSICYNEYFAYCDDLKGGEILDEGFQPYLDKKYLDCSYIIVGDRIINLDDLYLLIKDNINDDLWSENEGK